MSIYDIPPREGWRMHIDRRSGMYGSCPNCLHDNSRHFWWERGGQVGAEMERGCTACAQNICQSVRQMEETSMSSVNLCERCGTLMLAKALGRMELSRFPGADYERLELCPACITELNTFLAEKPERHRGEAFTEPWSPTPAKSESVMMLEAGPCGEQITENGVEFMCLRAKGHKGYHIDGSMEWLS